MQFEEDPRFTKKLKKLKKKYCSLGGDLKMFKKVLSSKGVPTDRHTVELYINNNIKIVKTRLFYRYLKGNTLRIILVIFLGVDKIRFIEIFYKGNKAREDQNRVREYSKF